ncbi:Asp-tRNA(Asn)/Glu-tRNA(Gln) amidotransferase subunit GatC [Desulfobacca acetoxidans]
MDVFGGIELAVEGNRQVDRKNIVPWLSSLFLLQSPEAREDFGMPLTSERVQQVARLARLTLAASEVELFTRQLNDILNYVEKLGELDTTDVPPMAHVLDVQNAFRDDATQGSLSVEEALANAPAAQRHFFVVPRVI